MTATRPLRRLDPSELDPDQRALYSAITGGPRADGPQHFRLVNEMGCLEGPFNAFLLQPAIGAPLQALGAAIRYDTSLTTRAREIAILVVATTWQSAFEQYAHEAIALAAGLESDELDAIRAGSDADDIAHWPDPDDLGVVRTARALSERGDLSDEFYASAVAVLGEAGLFELTALVGYYATLALQLRVFRVTTPDAPTSRTKVRTP